MTSLEPSYALQRLIRSRLVASADVVALVDPSAVLDRNDRPETLPAATVVIGEGMTLPGSLIDRSDFEVVLDLHIWAVEAGLATSKTIAHAVRAALVTGPWDVEDYAVADLRITSSRFIRDPSGKYSHAIISIEALMKETAS